MKSAIPCLHRWSRMARLLQKQRLGQSHLRYLSTNTSQPESSLSTDLPPSLLPTRSTPLRSPYRILHDKPFNPTRKQIKVIAPPPSYANKFKTPLLDHEAAQFALLDPSGTRRHMFSGPANPDSVRVGDMLHLTFAPPPSPITSTLPSTFNGIVLSIKSRGIDTSLVLRNKLENTGVELQVKVYSPTLKSVEIVQRAEGWMKRGKRPRRARLYYLRAEGGRKVGNGKQKKTTGKNHPFPNVEAEVREWGRRRKALRGMGLGEGDVSGRVGGGKGGKGRKR